MAKNWSLLVDPVKDAFLFTVYSKAENIEMLVNPNVLSQIVGEKNESRRFDRTAEKIRS